MAIVSSEFASGLFTTYSVVWESSFFAAESLANYPRYCDTFESVTAQNSYNFLDVPPAMRPWVGPRALQDIPAYTYTLVNNLYEGTLEVRRTALEDDQYGAIRQRVVQLGMEASRWIAYNASLALINGTTRLCYDGSDFFATGHSQGLSGSQSNLLTGTGVDTLAHLRADFIAARTAMRRMKDGAARPMNLEPDLIICPPEDQDLFDQLINSTLIGIAIGNAAAAPTNVLKSACDIMVDSNLTNTADWYMVSTSKAMKPMFYQHRAGPDFDALDNPSQTETVFMRDRLLYGVRARFAFGYAMWPLMIKTTN